MTAAPGLRARDRVLPLGQKTYVMAIVNLTDDSFSADGVGDDVEAAVKRAVQCEIDGADIIDIGAESARADAPLKDPSQEADLVGRAVSRIAAETGALLSVDTYKPAVAEVAVQAGAHMINDIAGMTEGSGTAEVAARTSASLVITFTRERPKVRPPTPPAYRDLIGEHMAFLRAGVDEAMAVGVQNDRIVIDPGIAFGKSHDEDLEVLRRLREFKAPGLPLLVAASRKHFIGSVTGATVADRDAGTLAVTALAIAGGADIVRVHDVRGNVEAARIADAIVRGQPGDYASSSQSWPWWTHARPIQGTTIDPGTGRD